MNHSSPSAAASRLALLLLLASLVIACGKSPSQSGVSADDAAQQWLVGVTSLNEETMSESTCLEQRDKMGGLTLDFWMSTRLGKYVGSVADLARLAEHLSPQGDLSGLSIVETSSDGDRAEVHVAGDIALSAGKDSQTVQIDESWAMVREDEAWRWCGSIAGTTQLTVIPPAPGADEILIPAGPFQMGCDLADVDCAIDEKPLHEVTLSAFAIDKYEVTNARYATCVDAGACVTPRSSSSHTRATYYGNPEFANYPVLAVDWKDAVIFCEWEEKRLPTEAEWEKAARGSGDTRIFPWGNETATCALANVSSEAADTYCVGDTAAVGSYPEGASPYGVMDMSGNVNEWVSDWYEALYYKYSPLDNPQGDTSGESQLLRGGAWDRNLSNARVSNRILPTEWLKDSGFRCARSQ